MNGPPLGDLIFELSYLLSRYYYDLALLSLANTLDLHLLFSRVVLTLSSDGPDPVPCAGHTRRNAWGRVLLVVRTENFLLNLDTLSRLPAALSFGVFSSFHSLTYYANTR